MRVVQRKTVARYHEIDSTVAMQWFHGNFLMARTSLHKWYRQESNADESPETGLMLNLIAKLNRARN